MDTVRHALTEENAKILLPCFINLEISVCAVQDVEASDQNQLGKEAHHVESSDAVIFLADNVTKKSPTMTDKSR